MTVHHRLSFNADIADRLLASQEWRLPTTLQRLGGRLVIEDISEDDSLWPTVARFLQEYNSCWTAHPSSARIVADFRCTRDPLADFSRAKFSDEERRSARFLSLGAVTSGYPQPSNPLEFYRLTYSSACPVCRHGATQSEHLRLSGEPRWTRRRGIFQLNWVDDEFLVKPEMFHGVFRPLGVTSRAVLHHRSGRPLDKVMQLNLPLSTEVDVSDATYQTCTRCGRLCYERNPVAYAPTPMNCPGVIFKSRQWFRPFHAIVYVSQELFRAIEASGFVGAAFQPCGPDS